MPSVARIIQLHAPPESRAVYGWKVILVAAAAMVGTLPGRTQGLGLITEPLFAIWGSIVSTYAQLNLWATIGGACFAIGIGRLMDRFGGRLVLTAVAVSLGVVVCAMSRAASMPGLALWVTLTRGFGQSALSVISIALVGQWFVRRIDTRDGGVQRRPQHRVHGRVSRGRMDRPGVGVARGVACDRLACWSASRP